MHIEREMGAMRARSWGESALKHPPPAARNWSQSGQNKPWWNDEKIYPVLHGRADRTRGNINCGANLVAAPEFSILTPLSAFGQSAISPIRRRSLQ